MLRTDIGGFGKYTFIPEHVNNSLAPLLIKVKALYIRAGTQL